MDNSHDIFSLNTDDEPAAASGRSHYSSALNPTFYTPVIRRRGSVSDNNRQSNPDDEPPSLPVRSRSGSHPLRAAGSSRGNGDAGVTRPHLSRIVNGTLVQVDSEGSSPTQEARQVVEELMVLVHEVKATDSLAGVSLKYGISMADLRKANKLWISDSIHLRNVLYIPIENAARAKEYILESKLLSLSTSDENKTSPPNPSEPFAGGSSDASPQSHATPSNLGTIRRVPATQLSFFPPPSQSPTKTASKRTPFDHQGRNHLYNSPSNAFGRYTTVPSHSLTSLLTALPISASTRDTIMARLSFDSTSSGTSESRPSDLDDALHERHELSDVHPRSLEGIFGFYPKNGRGPSPSRTPKPPNSPPPKASGHPASYHPRSALTPSSYIPTRTQVRTVQLEPSPIMELPLKAGSSRRAIRMKSQPNLLDGGVELRGTRTEA